MNERRPTEHSVKLGVFVLAVALVAGARIAARWADAVRYALAPACAAGERDGCVREVPATVFLRGERGWPREHVLYYRTGGDVGGGGEVTLIEPGGLFLLLGEATPIVLHVWGDHVVRVTLPGVGSLRTTDTPAAEALPLSAVVLAFGATGAMLVALGLRWYGAADGAVAVAIGAYALGQGQSVMHYPEELVATFAVATVGAGVALVRFRRTTSGARPPTRRAALPAAR